MSVNSLCLGRSAEEEAARFLRDNGYKILARNYRTKLGEIDIVACEKDTFCFIEVKARTSERFGVPQEAVSAAKKRQIQKAALHFIKKNKLFERKARFDVVSLLYSGAIPKIEIIKNAFELDGDFSV